MSMSDQEIIKLLDYTGHIESPFGNTRDESRWPLSDLTFDDQCVIDAVGSYQDMHAIACEPLIAQHYPERNSAAVRMDGRVGPAMRELFEMPRCGFPDYPPSRLSDVQEANGTGNWYGCYGAGDFHHVKVRFLNEPPSFLDSVWDEIWEGVVDAYAAVGLLLTRDDEASPANIEISFVRGSGWIGLAIVSNNSGCRDTIWAKFDKNFRPSDLVRQWILLLLHEIGHNCGLEHSRGGIMNAFLLQGIAVSWLSDTSFPLMKRRFGGKPFPRGDEPFVWAVGKLFDSGRFKKVYELKDPPPGIMWPT